MLFNKNNALKLFNKFKQKAKKLIDDPAKVEIILNKANEKQKKSEGHLSNVLDDIRMMSSLIKDWMNGSYHKIPKGTIIAMVGAIIYFVSPIDILPDFILGLGFFDDVFIISTVIKQMQSDIEKYKIWKANIQE